MLNLTTEPIIYYYILNNPLTNFSLSNCKRMMGIDTKSIDPNNYNDDLTVCSKQEDSELGTFISHVMLSQKYAK